LSQFLKKYPQIQLNLELAERIPDLEKEGIDILIGMGLTPPGDIVQKKIMNNTLCLLRISKVSEKVWHSPKTNRPHRTSVHHPQHESEGEIPIYVAYLYRKYLPSKIRAFIDFFTQFL